MNHLYDFYLLLSKQTKKLFFSKYIRLVFLIIIVVATAKAWQIDPLYGIGGIVVIIISSVVIALITIAFKKHKRILDFLGFILLISVILAWILFLTSAFLQFPRSLRDLFGKYRKVTVTVVVYWKGDMMNQPLKELANVRMDNINGDTRTAKINENGEAIFTNIDLNTQARFDISDFSEPFHSKKTDSIYLINDTQKIYLEVYLENIDKVTGYVVYEDAPLEGVQVTLKSLKDTTDRNGGYSIQIPEALQEKVQTISFFKDGYELFIDENVFPQKGQVPTVVMKKLK